MDGAVEEEDGETSVAAVWWAEVGEGGEREREEASVSLDFVNDCPTSCDVLSFTHLLTLLA